MKVLSQHHSVHEEITRKIIAMIETSAGSYRAPWYAVHGPLSLPMNATTHASYRGVNVLSLWIDAQQRDFELPYWASYRQWRSIGAQVRKGERGSLVVFYKRLDQELQADETDTEHGRKARFVARASYVFNAGQVDGFEAESSDVRTEIEQIQEIEGFVQALNAKVNHGFTTARYRPDVDIIEMPHRQWFISTRTSSAAQNYYAVLLHELTHWVGAPHRLNREFGKRFGDRAYAMEELVAELGAAFLCAAFGISSEPRPDHAAYVSSWLDVLNRDPKAIFTAATKAHEAFEHLSYLAMRTAA